MPAHTVHLVDASPYLFRAHFSLPESIRDPAGARVGAVYGFASFLLKLIDDERPTHLGVAFDRNLTGSFRNRLYPAYKEQRDAPPPELLAQIDPCLDVARALGAAVYIDDEYEADDLIAALCLQLTRRGHGVVIVTSDKDLAQLVGERVALLDFAKGERYGPAEVRAKFGVPPERIPDLLGLAGDPVDNIPGVKGIGKKTAVELISAYGDLDGIYGSLDEIARSKLRGAGGLAARLAEAREIAFLSRRLATAATDAPARADLGELAYRGPDAEAVPRLFDRLGFKSLRERALARRER